MTHYRSCGKRRGSLFLLLFLVPFLGFAQSGGGGSLTPEAPTLEQDDATKLAQRQAEVQEYALILSDDQKAEYINAFWYRYATLGKQAEIDKLCPHFPTPDMTRQDRVTHYTALIDAWMARYPRELVDFEKAFHPEMVFHHDLTPSDGVKKDPSK